VLRHLVSVLTLYPLGQPEKALGHEPQIEPWLTLSTATLAKFQRPIGVVATNNEDSAVEIEQGKLKGHTGRKQKPSASHNAEGLEVKESFSTSGRGKSIFLDIPLYRTGVSTNYDSGPAGGR